MKLLKLTLTLVVCSAAACEMDEPGPFDKPDDPPPKRVASIAGAVIDWETGTPVEGASVVVELGWADPLFPTEGAGLESVTTDSEGRFGPTDVVFDGEGFTGIVLLRASGAGLAPTGSDQRMVCDASDPVVDSPIRCEPVDHKIVAASASLAAVWRDQLVREGLADTDAGLVLFEFLEVGGAPAAAVETKVADLETAVRYLDDEGINIDPDATATTASGLALVAPDEDAVFVFGERSAQEWKATGVLVAPGWIFVEDRTVTP